MPKKNIITDKELRFEIAKKVFDKIGEKFTGKTYTDEEIRSVCDDEKKIENHEKALKLINRDKEQSKIMKSILSKYDFNIPVSTGRLCGYLIEVPDENATDKEKEAIAKRNEELVLDMCNPKKVGKYIDDVIQKTLNFDYTKMFVKTPEEAIEFYKENASTINLLFVIDSVLDNCGYKIDPKVRAQITKFKGLAEESGYVKDMVYNIGSNVPFIIPNDLDCSKVDSTAFLKVVSSVLNEYRDVEGFEFSTKFKDAPEETVKEFFSLAGNEKHHFEVGEVFFEDLKSMGLENSKDLLINYGCESGSYPSKILEKVDLKHTIESLEEVNENKFGFDEKAVFCAKLGIEFNENITKEELYSKAKELYDSIKIKDLCNLKKNSEEEIKELTEKFKKPVLERKTGNPIYRQAKPAHDALIDFMRKPDRYKKFFTESDALTNKECSMDDAKDLIKLYSYGKWKQETRGFFRKLFRRGACRKEDEAVKNVQQKLDLLGFSRGLQDAYRDLMSSRNINFDKIASVSAEGPLFLSDKEYRQKEFFDAKDKVEEFEASRKNVEIKDLELGNEKEEEIVLNDNASVTALNNEEIEPQNEF